MTLSITMENTAEEVHLPPKVGIPLSTTITQTALPDIYKAFNPMPYEEVCDKEVEVGIDLRSAGFGFGRREHGETSRMNLMLPLYRPPLFPQSEAVDLFVVPQIAEHRLHGGETSAILDSPFRAVDMGFHLVSVALMPAGIALGECDLPSLVLRWGA